MNSMQHSGDAAPPRAAASVPEMSCFLKITSQRETAALAMVDAALPGIAPKFLQAVPLCEDDPAGGDYLLLMEDCCPGRRATLTRLFTARTAKPRAGLYLQRVLQALAALHWRFRDLSAALTRQGIPLALSGPEPAPDQTRDIVERAIRLLPPDCGSSEQLRERCLSLAGRMRGFVDRLNRSNRHTLVHGDFHFDNVVIGRQGRPVLADWGAAAIANPCWDLAFCGPAEVAVYCAAIRTGAGPQPRYCGEDHRAAVAVRMLLLAGAALAVTQEPQRRRLGTALPVIMANFAKAADPEFRGGIGFRAF